MKKRILLTFLAVLVLFTFNFSNEQAVYASSTKIMEIKAELVLWDSPKENAKKISVINKHSKVIIHGHKNHWYYVEYKGKKGYIKSSSFKKTKQQTKVAPPIITNGLMPKVGRQYTYEPSFEGQKKKTYIASNNPYVRNSVQLLENDYIGYTYIETNESFQFGVAYSDVFFFSLTYPLKENTTIYDVDESPTTIHKTKVFVESTSATITTKAGTFKNVVVLKYPNGSMLYFSKDYGIIRMTDFNGNITTELIGVK